MIIKPNTLLELFENHPERFTKRQNARTGRWGEPCRPADPRAACWCVYGAFLFVYGQGSKRSDQASQRLSATLRRYGRDGSLVSFGDCETTTFQDVVSLIREAKV